METLLSQIVFTVGDHPYEWADVVLAARLWRDWAVLEEEVRQGLACVKRLQAADEEFDPAQVTAAAEEFRYERDLLTASEAEAWLERWGLTAERWMDYIERSVLRNEWAPELSTIVAKYPVGPDEVADVIWVDGVCSGNFGHFARKLAGRAAVYHRMQEERRREASPGWCDETATVTGIPAQELPGMDPSICQQKMVTLARFEPTFARFQEQVLSLGAIRDAVSAHHLDWIRLHCHCLAFPDQQMAQEALLCIREDGADLTEVSRAAKCAVHETRFFLEEADAGSRHAFLSAKTGDLLGPLPTNGGFSLFRVHAKVLPSAEDPIVRPRAERDVLSRAVEQEINNSVRWRLPL